MQSPPEQQAGEYQEWERDGAGRASVSTDASESGISREAMLFASGDPHAHHTQKGLFVNA